MENEEFKEKIFNTEYEIIYRRRSNGEYSAYLPDFNVIFKAKNLDECRAKILDYLKTNSKISD